MLASVVLFVVLYLYIANRHAIGFLEQIVTGKKLIKKVCKDPKILNIINKKASLHLKHFFIYTNNRAWAFMAGIPGKPQLFLRQDIYHGDFSKDEMQWLLLHEAGHYKLWHTTREFFHQLISAIFGIWVLSFIHNIFLAILGSFILAIILGIYAVQIGKICEYEAEKYALSRLDNSRGMIKSGKRAIAGWKKSGLPKKSLIHKVFDRWEFQCIISV